MTTPNDVDWLLAYLKPLEGATILRSLARLEDGEVWPTLLVRTTEGQILRLEVSRDEEGNGPGFLFGLPAEVNG